MKSKLSLLVTAIGLLAFPATSQQSDQVPATCRPDARGAINYQACADVVPTDSPARALALINLGTEAFIDGNYAEAVRLYDEAVPPGKQIKSDARFHAFRAGAYSHVGRAAEAYKDARLALDILNGKSDLPADLAAIKVDPTGIYEIILPILKQNRDPGFSGALSAYTATTADDWIGWANRAAMLEQINELAAAIEASDNALKLNPAHPGVLNNHCYILARAGKAADALPYCQKAIEGAPNVAGSHHSFATALALAGRCAESRAELDVARRLDPSAAAYQQPIACPAS